ncbi:endogenous retrovirus group 3 member 1 Env polyprotein-like [Narcine bancroftii]|uniref:endogenous retrovirus group 3 member 1 Env polyprotein-like n=1 Tax=Narcine bancroftii TaxID=1343680 RepID=UPI0038310B8D
MKGAGMSTMWGLWALVVQALEGAGEENHCMKCVHSAWGSHNEREQYFADWTNFPEHCVGTQTGRKCVHNGQVYDVKFNRGSLQVTPNQDRCPQGVTWFCAPEGDQDKEKGGSIPIQRIQWEPMWQTGKQPYVWDRDKGDIYANAKRQAATQRAGDNRWVDLCQTTAELLGVKNCWVCGGPTRDGSWPWSGEPLEVWELMSFHGLAEETRPRQIWHLANHPLGEECIRKEQGHHYKGDSRCTRVKILGKFPRWHPQRPRWFLSPQKVANCKSITAPSRGKVVWNCTGVNPYEGVPSLRQFWAHLYPHGFAPEGLYWICGNMAYTFLEPDWRGTCCIGIIQPQFVLLPQNDSHQLATQVYQGLHQKRELKIGEWGEDWPPERIISYYGPATWAQDGSWGYRTPIYMLNRLIRLQAILEIIFRYSQISSRPGSDLATLGQRMAGKFVLWRLGMDTYYSASCWICGFGVDSDPMHPSLPPVPHSTSAVT